MLATPVVLWGGYPFFKRGVLSVIRRSLNMFTLIALGVGVAYIYSVVATLVPGIFPSDFQGHGGQVLVYFEAAAVITVLVLLGQVLASKRFHLANFAFSGLRPFWSSQVFKIGYIFSAKVLVSLVRVFLSGSFFLEK